MPVSPHRPFAAALALSIALSASAAGAATHPSLLFSREDVPAIRASLDGPLAQVKSALEAGVHFPFVGDYPKTPDLGWQYYGDRRAIADTLVAFAFGAAVLDPDTGTGREAGELALNYLRGICAYGDWIFPETQDDAKPDLNSAHFLFGVSVAYDWLYDRLTESERQRCRDRVAVEGEKMYQATRDGWWVPEYLQNHNWINHASLGMAALAFDGEIPRDTNAWLEAAKANSEKVRYVLDLIHGGAWHEGTGYLHYGLDSLIPFSVALERSGRGPDYAANRIVRDYARLRMQMMPPALAHRREYVLWGDFSGLQNENTLLPLFYAARKWGDGTAMWYARQFLEGQTAGKGGLTSWPPGQRGMLTAAILYAANVAEEPPARAGAAWELDHYAQDLSLFTSRSGWEDGGALVALKSGVFGGWGNFERLMGGGAPGGSINFGHDHADDMGLQFFADGEWLTTRVPGYWIGRANGAPEVNRTKFANSLLVDGGGQVGEGVRTCWMGSCPWFWTRQGSIPVRGSTSNFSYAVGAGAQLYDPALGLNTFDRAVLFVDRRFPVVRDVVRGSSARTYEIAWHAADAASREGSWLRLNAKNDRVLGVKVVAPAAFETRTETQTAVHLDKIDADKSMTALFVRPSTPSPDATFLSALVPARGATWASKPSVEPIDAAAPDRGLVIAGLSDGARYDVVFGDGTGVAATAAGITVDGGAGVRRMQDGAVDRVMLAAGRRLEIDGEAWIEVRSGEPASIEVDVRADGVAISGDDRPLRVYAPGASAVTYNGTPVAFERDGDHLRVPGAPADSVGDDGSGGAGGVDGGAGWAGGAGGSGGSIPAPGKRHRGGCASAGGGVAPLALAVAALAFSLPRRRRHAPVAVRAKR